MSWQLTKASHIGGREEQQDRVAFFEDLEQARYCAVLADGMGGHQGGAMAAQTLIDCTEQQWQIPATPEIWLQNLCEQTHQCIQALGEAHNINPRTTAVIVLIEKKRLYWTHIGDSRFYHIRGNRIIQQSEDHSVVQMLVALGKITAEEMANHPDQNRLIKSVGGKEALSIEIEQTKIKSGDRFALCSDGLWETITPNELIQASQQADLQQSTEQLVAQAAERGGQAGDNISLCFARYQADSLWEKLSMPFF